jgi:hypothetical protein
MVYVRVGSPLEASKRFPVLLSFWMGNEPRQQRRRWMSTYTPVHGVQGWVGDVCSVNIVVHEGAYRTGRTDGQRANKAIKAIKQCIWLSTHDKRPCHVNEGIANELCPVNGWQQTDGVM